MSMIVAVAAATVAQFAVGGVWYMAVFGKSWGRIHGFDKLPKAKQDQMAKEIMPWYAAQVSVTVFAAWTLAKLIQLLPGQSPYAIAVMVWFGFILPTQASSIIFGNDDKKVLPTKLAITSVGSLVCTLVGAAVIQALL